MLSAYPISVGLHWRREADLSIPPTENRIPKVVRFTGMKLELFPEPSEDQIRWRISKERFDRECCPEDKDLFCRTRTIEFFDKKLRKRVNRLHFNEDGLFFSKESKIRNPPLQIKRFVFVPPPA